MWVGDVFADDLAEYWQAYLANPNVLDIRRTLVDLRQSTIHFSGEDLARLITEIVNPTLQGRDWITAIIVEGESQYGVSRQYQVFAERYSRDAIFREYDQALQWLLRQP